MKNVKALQARLHSMKGAVISGAVLAVSAVGQAQAALDVTDATAAIADGVTAASAIGVAFLAFKIIKRVWARL